MTSSFFSIREATPADSHGIALLEEALFPDNWLSASTITNELERGPSFVLVGEHGTVGGYILTNLRDGVLDVLRLGVAPERRGYGWGRILMRWLLVFTHHWLCVLTVRKNNKVAVGLYKVLKFEMVGETEESWVLTRTSSRPIPDRTRHT